MPIMDDPGSLLRVIGSPAYFFDVSMHEILAVNRPFIELMEYSEAELLQMTVFDLRPAEDVSRLVKALSLSPPEGSAQ